MDCPTRATLVNDDAASSMDVCEATHLNGVIVCTVGEDGTVLARLPDESEAEIPWDAVNRSQVLQDAVEAADCGVSFDLPAREGCAWLQCLWLLPLRRVSLPKGLNRRVLHRERSRFRLLAR